MPAFIFREDLLSSFEGLDVGAELALGDGRRCGGILSRGLEEEG
jgi:hypothetical protein